MFDDPDTFRAFFREPLGCRTAAARPGACAAERPAARAVLTVGSTLLLRLAIALRLASALRFPVNRIQARSRRRYGDV